MYIRDLKSTLFVNLLPLLLGAVFIIFALYPYWVFGEYSVLGLYDEVDGQIP